MRLKRKNKLFTSNNQIRKNIKVRKKLILIIFIILVPSFLLSGCYDKHEVDEMAYVMGIGLDKGRAPNSLMMTLQIAVPKEIGSTGDEGDGGGEKNKATTITTLETPSIFTGINMINNYESKQINFSHSQLLVFSEELAREGIEKHIHTIARSDEFRGGMHVLISKTTAEEYLRNVEPLLEINPSKFYRMEYGAYRYTGFTADTTFINFHLKSDCFCSQPVAILASVGRFEDSDEITIEGSTYKEKDREYPLGGDYTAGNIPRVAENKAEIMGLAVFDGAKMVGVLDGAETTHYLIVTNQYKHSYITVPDPLEEDSFVVLDIEKRRKPVIKVKIVDGKPKIEVKVELEGDIISIQSGINYEEASNTKILEKGVEKLMGERMLAFLEKTSKEFGSDICGFGEKVRTKFITWDSWSEFKWLERYMNSDFSVDVNFKIRRPGLIIRTTSISTSSKGRER